jgi:hypothetical protein
VRETFPWVIVGDIEPTPSPVTVEGLAEWMDAYRSAVGEPMAFLHLDLDWSQPSWSAFALDVQTDGDARDVATGIIYTGGAAPDDAQWIGLAGQRALDHEDRDGGSPDHVIFQSWNDHPDHVLPETDANAFTAFIDRYFDDRASLGMGGHGNNLAFRSPATASAQLPGSPASQAVDGDPDTIWNAGAGPVAWIDIDLGAVVSIGHVRLVTAQNPAGPTEHKLLGAAAPGGELVLLTTLSGPTSDYQVLEVDASGWPPVRIVRVLTTASPSWVAWREVEIEAP